MKKIFLIAGIFILFLVLSMSCGEGNNDERNMENTVPYPPDPSPAPQADSPGNPPQVNDTPGSDTSARTNSSY